MPFPLPVGHKFSCIALSFVRVVPELRAPVDLGDGLWILPEPPFEFETHWREWLGSVRTEQLSNANFVILAHQSSADPTVIDNENEDLTKKCSSVFYALLVSEIFHHERGLVLSGANVDGVVNVRNVGNLESHHRPNGVRTANIEAALIQRASLIAAGIRTVHAAGHSQRLHRGFQAWIKGAKEYYADDKLHQFVRAVEGVIKPEIGQSKKQFMHRGQVFAGNSATAKNLLGELYDLRSQAEHLHLFGAVLNAYPPDERQKVALCRAYQGQLLASYVYGRIFSNTHLQTAFGTDAAIDAFWNQTWAQQTQAWGQPIDLEAAAKARFTGPF